jgi:GT2 family glycosyltransferase
MQHGIRFRITTLRNESLITRARNILTAMFLEDSSCTHLMFIDADIEFDPDSVIRMLAMDKDIIAGAYPKKTINWGNVKAAAKSDVEHISTYGADYAINLKFDPTTKKVRTHMGAVEVLDASTGFFIVKRNVMIEEPLDESRGWNEEEDVEWSYRVRNKYVIKCNGKSIVRHNKWHRHAGPQR